MTSRLASIPSTFRKIVVQKLTTNFPEATEIVSAPMPKPSATEILIKNRYLGVNASDINVTAGRYFTEAKTPFGIGFEALGEVVSAGSDVRTVSPGDAVAVSGMAGCFSEYMCVPQQQVWNLPSMNSDFLALIVSGRTAAISLDKCGNIKKNEVVLVTAAAGGTGQFAVQYAKYTGCHVIGTCSTDDKVQMLKKLGCHRPVNYKKEDLGQVLKKEYPNGVDVVWETIGGNTFTTCLQNLAIRGRLIVMGFIQGYESKEGYAPIELSYLPVQLIKQSASVNGFMLFHYTTDFQYYHAKLIGMHERRKLKVITDFGEKTNGGVFQGLESVARAVEHLHSGKSSGKVVVELL